MEEGKCSSMHESSVVRNISRPVETHGTLHMSSRFRNYARLLLALKRRERGQQLCVANSLPCLGSSISLFRLPSALFLSEGCIKTHLQYCARRPIL